MRPGPQAEADDEIGGYEGQEGKREVTAGLDREIRVEFGPDFVGQIEMLAFDEHVVGHTVGFLKNALRGNPTGEGVGGAAFAGNDNQQLTMHFVQQTPRLADRSGQVRQMLEDVDGYVAVEKTVGEIHPLLAVADDGLDAGMTALDLGGHVLAEFVAVIIGLLLRGELFVVQVAAEAGSDFDGGFEAGPRLADGKSVVEILDQPIAAFARELNMPALHEIVIDALLLGRERGQDLGPLGGNLSLHDE